MIYAFTHMENFLLLLLRTFFPPTFRPRFQSLGIWASRLGFGPRGWDMGFEAEIWAWRLGGGGYGEGGMEEKEEKIPLCERLGHRPLHGRFPKTADITNKLPMDGPTDRRTDR